MHNKFFVLRNHRNRLRFLLLPVNPSFLKKNTKTPRFLNEKKSKILIQIDISDSIIKIPT